jgi:hypothetical protein
VENNKNPINVFGMIKIRGIIKSEFTGEIFVNKDSIAPK